jgi:hypothetical protein
MPTQTPALNIPPTTAQEERTNINANALSQTAESFFIIFFGCLCKSFAAVSQQL